jgi:hypothetical protein
MVKSINIALIFLLVLATQLHAQNTQNNNRDVNVFPEQVSIEHNEAVERFSRDLTLILTKQLTGAEALNDAVNSADQVAIIDQFGDNNVAEIFQSGFGNFAKIDIKGNRNNARIDQDGNNNRALLNIFANDNVISLLQEGNNNFIEGNFREDGFAPAEPFSQIGNNLNIQVTGSGGIPMIIEQTGQGAGLIIRNN